MSSPAEAPSAAVGLLEWEGVKDLSRCLDLRFYMLVSMYVLGGCTDVQTD